MSHYSGGVALYMWSDDDVAVMVSHETSSMTSADVVVVIASPCNTREVMND